MKTIVFINHWAAGMGGAEHSLLDILEKSAPRFKTILVTTEPGPLVTQAQAKGTIVKIIPCSSFVATMRRGNLLVSCMRYPTAIISFAAYVMRLQKVLKSISPDMVHANVPKSHIALMLCSWIGYKGRICLHMREIFERSSLPFQLYAVLFRPRVMQCIAISQAVVDALPLRIKKHSALIYNGVTIPEPQKKKPQGMPLQFIYLGRIVPWKGCHLLIDAFSRICALRQQANIGLSLVGDTLYWAQSYRETLQAQIAALPTSQPCVLLPYSVRAQEMLLEHDVFVCASDKEPFGRSIAEASACSLPVVAFDSGGISEIIVHDQTGLLVPYGDVDKLAEAMIRCIDNPAFCSEMGKNGYARAQSLFNKEKQVESVLVHVQSCAEKPCS